MKKITFRIIAFALLMAITLSVIAFADSAYPTTAEGTSKFPDISAKSYVLADANTGEVLFCHNENQRMPIASTTKVLTCLVALERVKLDDAVTVNAESCGIEGSSIYLYEGEKLYVRDLLYALMLESANDAAVCLAYHVAGSVEAFSELMNSKASELGLTNSHFNNPHGLEDSQHYSTALDMARIWCEAMKNDTFREIVSTKTYRMDLEEEDSYRFLSNHNRLLKTYDDCIGGKTGYTKTAGRCLISGAERNGAELVMVTLNDPNDWSDHEALLDYALSLYSSVEVASEGSVTHTVSVVGGKDKSVALKNADTLKLTLRDVTKLKSHLEAPRFVYAPLKDLSQPLAYVVYTIDGQNVATLPLYPEKTVEAVQKESFFKRILNIFK